MEKMYKLREWRMSKMKKIIIQSNQEVNLEMIIQLYDAKQTHNDLIKLLGESNDDYGDGNTIDRMVRNKIKLLGESNDGYGETIDRILRKHIKIFFDTLERRAWVDVVDEG